MPYQREAQLEQSMLEQLTGKGYESVSLPGYDALVANFRKQLTKFNHKKLGGTPLSDNEFNRLLTRVDKKSIFESAKILRDKVIQMFHTNRGSEFKNQLIDETLAAFQIDRSLSMKGYSYDNAAAEAIFKISKTEFVSQMKFESLEHLTLEFSDYIN